MSQHQQYSAFSLMMIGFLSILMAGLILSLYVWVWFNLNSYIHAYQANPFPMIILTICSFTIVYHFWMAGQSTLKSIK